MSFGRCVMLRNMMDGFQTKTEFEERAAERLPADDGWIGQLHRLATAHSARNTTHHTTQKIRKNSRVLAGNTHTLLTHPHLDDKITSHGLYKIHKLWVLCKVCLLYSSKRENLISVRGTESKKNPKKALKLSFNISVCSEIYELRRESDLLLLCKLRFNGGWEVFTAAAVQSERHGEGLVS